MSSGVNFQVTFWYMEHLWVLQENIPTTVITPAEETEEQVNNGGATPKKIIRRCPSFFKPFVHLLICVRWIEFCMRALCCAVQGWLLLGGTSVWPICLRCTGKDGQCILALRVERWMPCALATCHWRERSPSSSVFQACPQTSSLVVLMKFAVRSRSSLEPQSFSASVAPWGQCCVLASLCSGQNCRMCRGLWTCLTWAVDCVWQTKAVQVGTLAAVTSP